MPLFSAAPSGNSTRLSFTRPNEGLLERLSPRSKRTLFIVKSSRHKIVLVTKPAYGLAFRRKNSRDPGGQRVRKTEAGLFVHVSFLFFPKMISFSLLCDFCLDQKV